MTLLDRINYRIGSLGVWLCNHFQPRPVTQMEAKSAFKELQWEMSKRAVVVAPDGENKFTATMVVPPSGSA